MEEKIPGTACWVHKRNVPIPSPTSHLNLTYLGLQGSSQWVHAWSILIQPPPAAAWALIRGSCAPLRRKSCSWSSQPPVFPLIVSARATSNCTLISRLWLNMYRLHRPRSSLCSVSMELATSLPVMSRIVMS